MKQAMSLLVLAGCLNIPAYREPDANVDDASPDAPAMGSATVRVRTHDHLGTVLDNTPVWFIDETGSRMSVTTNMDGEATHVIRKNTTIVAMSEQHKELTVMYGVQPNDEIAIGSPPSRFGRTSTFTEISAWPGTWGADPAHVFAAFSPCGSGSKSGNGPSIFVYNDRCGTTIDLLVMRRPNPFAPPDIVAYTDDRNASAPIDASMVTNVLVPKRRAMYSLTPPARGTYMRMFQRFFRGDDMYGPIEIAGGTVTPTTDSGSIEVAYPQLDGTELIMSLEHSSAGPLEWVQQVFYRTAASDDVTIAMTDDVLAPFLGTPTLDVGGVTFTPLTSAPAQLAVIEAATLSGGVPTRRWRYIMPAPALEAGVPYTFAFPALPDEVLAVFPHPTAATAKVTVMFFRMDGVSYDRLRPTADGDSMLRTFNGTLNSARFTASVGRNTMEWQ